jgi:predicted Zn-dependent peptidase
MAKSAELTMRIILTLLIGTFLMGTSLPKHYTETLKNGLKIIAIPMNKGSNVITTNIVYKVGSRNEVMGKSGIAHMLEHLNFKSTKNLKAGEFDEIVKGFGGVNNASTSFDYTQYFIKSSSSNLDKSLELFAELMANLNLKEEEFQTERDVVAQERLWRTDNNPMGYLYFRLFNNAFLYHPYHWTPIGFMNDIKNWTLEDIKQFHKKHYSPNNAIVVVAGDIDENEVFQKTKKHFSPISSYPLSTKLHTVEPKQDGEKNITVHKKTDVQMLGLAYHTPSFNHEDQMALSAISELLSNGKSSILQKEIIDKQKLANSIYGYSMDTKDPGVFIFIATCNEGVEAKKIQQQIIKILQKLKDGKITASQIKKIKINLKAQFINSLESSSEVANLFAEYAAKEDLNVILDYEKDIENITKEKLVEVANKYFIMDNSTTVVLKESK